MKVKDLAKELGKKPKDFIKILTSFDIKVKSENSRLDDQTIALIKDLFNNDKEFIEETLSESKRFNLSENQNGISKYKI